MSKRGKSRWIRLELALFVLAPLCIDAGALQSQASRAQKGEPRAASQPPISAPISDVRYDVTFDRQTAAHRALHVVTTFAVQGSEPVLLSLPEWTPGAYELSWFSRWVSNFSAS